MATEQQTVIFAGRVQGVGFRYTTCRVAGGHDVTGYVKNLPDGRVECVAEGERAELTAFLTELERVMGNHITGRTGYTAPVTNEFADFSVRY